MNMLVDSTQALMAGIYLQDAAATRDLNCDVTMPTMVICDECGELTHYSSEIVKPNVPFDKLCLSRDCISKAIFKLGVQLTRNQHRCGEGRYEDVEFD